MPIKATELFGWMDKAIPDALWVWLVTVRARHSISDREKMTLFMLKSLAILQNLCGFMGAIILLSQSDCTIKESKLSCALSFIYRTAGDQDLSVLRSFPSPSRLQDIGDGWRSGPDLCRQQRSYSIFEYQ